MHYLGIETHLPDLGRGSLEGGQGRVGIDIEDANEAVEGRGGGDGAEGVGGDGSDAEAVAGVGALKDEFIGPPKPDGLVEGTGEEERGSGSGCGYPCHRPHRILVRALHRFDSSQFHCNQQFLTCSFLTSLLFPHFFCSFSLRFLLHLFNGCR